METDLREAMTSGVLVEFCDERGNCVGQSVYLDWRGRPLPAVGDTLTCGAPGSSGGGRKLSGRVSSRVFDVQRDEHGAVSVWVRLVVDISPRAARRAAPMKPHRSVVFSDN